MEITWRQQERKKKITGKKNNKQKEPVRNK